jgi:DNA polymerase (family 10)
LDLKDVYVRQALAAGVMLVIDTDAHSANQLDQMRFGVMTARRGGARRKQVLNALSTATLLRKIRAT